MKIYEVYRKPGVDMSSIERFCADAQIVLEKLEEAQKSGASLAEDYARVALVSVRTAVSRWSLIFQSELIHSLVFVSWRRYLKKTQI